jgi:hypothetical protein
MITMFWQAIFEWVNCTSASISYLAFSEFNFDVKIAIGVIFIKDPLLMELWLRAAAFLYAFEATGFVYKQVRA